MTPRPDPPVPRLTMSRRFTFCASHRVARPDWPDARNLEVFGDEARGAHGHGHNYEAYLVFSGPVDAATGIMANLAEIKRRVATVVDGRYDHRFLNLDTPPFDRTVPTPEAVAREILAETAVLFRSDAIRPVATHVVQDADEEATAYAGRPGEWHRWISFSAARRTVSPHLSEEANRARFGIAAAPGGHGHNYRLRVTLPARDAGGAPAATAVDRVLGELRAALDHRNLNVEVPFLAGLPTTTEVLARVALGRLVAELPVIRVRLHELPEFFAEAAAGAGGRLGVVRCFSAAHRLDSPALTAEQNRALYGKCNNPNGHGHSYRVEATVSGPLDPESGTIDSLDGLVGAVEAALAPWRYRHLDREVEDFAAVPSTGENIVSRLWARLQPSLACPLARLRLGETLNNRFTLRAGTETA